MYWKNQQAGPQKLFIETFELIIHYNYISVLPLVGFAIISINNNNDTFPNQGKTYSMDNTCY